MVSIFSIKKRILEAQARKQERLKVLKQIAAKKEARQEVELETLRARIANAKKLKLTKTEQAILKRKRDAAKRKKASIEKKKKAAVAFIKKRAKIANQNLKVLLEPPKPVKKKKSQFKKKATSKVKRVVKRKKKSRK